MAERLPSQPAFHDSEDLEEFVLLLRSDDATALIEAAGQQGLTAAGLTRRLICDYLRHAGHAPHRECLGGRSHP
jgi:hypothetical protein